ncbi:hypothetical protein F5Y18DRAFT_271346 [Xylariaceae sp. FL1019]|nr:hypothetical protein F5Y18DRAFT_271346 [Xylariaceae sp. FL1019]
MPIVHIVLCKLKPNGSEAQIAELRAAGESMVGAIPGLQTFKMGPPLAITAQRAKGFDMAVYTVLDTEKDLLAYAGHPAHLQIHHLRLPLVEDTLVYDMEI